MKFLAWLFDINSRHLGDSIRYQKGKISTKIWAIIIVLIFGAATLGVEYWGFNLLNNNLSGIVVLILLFIPLIATTLEFGAFYASLGFRMFFAGTLESLILRAENKKRQKKTEKSTADAQNIADQTTSESAQNTINAKSQKNHKWLDLFVGIFCTLLCIAVLVMVFVVPNLTK